MIRTLLFVSLLITACDPAGSRSSERWFFDLQAFADAERLRLQSGVPVDKSVTIDGAVESRHIDAYTWTAELDMMDQWDINRPAWKDQYVSDTILNGTQKMYRYKATKPDLQVRELTIYTSMEQVDSLFIQTRVKNPLHTTTADLIYRRDKEFYFTQISRRRFGPDKDLRVVVRQIGS